MTSIPSPEVAGDDAFMQPLEVTSREVLIQMVYYYQAQDGLLTKAQDEAQKLREELAEVHRPLDAQMARLNNRVIELTAQLDATKADAAVRAKARRYEWLKARLLCADFSYGDPSEACSALVFEIPDEMEVSSDLDATIDAFWLNTSEDFKDQP